MSTYPPTLTTDELIRACAEAEAGVEVSATQLTSWLHEGLIPAELRRRHGRGRGLGTDWLWEHECLERALIIGRTLKVGDPSFKRAALMLASLGYVPAARWLRILLLDGLTMFDKLTSSRQSYLDLELSRDEKLRRLTRHVRSQTNKPPYYEEPISQSLIAFGAALQGLPKSAKKGASDGGSAAEAAETQPEASLQIATMRQRITEIDETTLLENYRRAQDFVPHVDRFWEPLLALQAAFLRTPGPAQDKKMGDDAVLLGCTHEAAVAISRLIFTFLLTVLPISDEAQMTDLGQWIFRLMEPFAAHAGTTWPKDEAESS